MTLAGMIGSRANRRRGEVVALIDGERRILCLTLGALAELETAFAVDDLSGLTARFSSGKLKAADMIRIIGAGLRGGGNLLCDDEVAAMSVEGGIATYAGIIGELLTATFAGRGEAVSANP
ncbi:gene transfer agent family protein [Aliirhizobium smilacinae]|nr:gene transfer agent family protein [Rhizobium smilacinae]